MNQHEFLSYFFVKKIPLSRRVEYVMDGSMDQSVSESVSDRCIYYIDESVLLGTKPLVDSLRHFIRDPSGVFSVCHLCVCHIVQ